LVSDLELGYVAGMLDGEGAIYLQKAQQQGKGSWIQPIVDISNNDQNALEYIRNLYGGSINTVNSRGHHLRLWRNNEIKKLLDDVCPYLIVKKEEAKIMLLFLESRHKLKGKRYTENELAWYKALKMLHEG